MNTTELFQIDGDVFAASRICAITRVDGTSTMQVVTQGSTVSYDQGSIAERDALFRRAVRDWRAALKRPQPKVITRNGK
jgi:translation elongation factor EF-G